MNKQNKKILVWDGIFQGYKHITKEEMEERKKLQKKMRDDWLKVFKWIGIGLIIYIILMWWLLSL